MTEQKTDTTEFCKKYLGITPNPILQKIFTQTNAGESLVINQPPAHLERMIKDAEEIMLKFIKENL